jgi:hypothetical protein
VIPGPTDPRVRAGRSTSIRGLRLSGGALFLGVALLVAACGSTAPSAAGTPGASGGGTPTTPAAPSSAAAASLPADRLTAAFTAMGGGYTYETTVTIDGKVASTAKGRWVGGSSEFVITTGGQSVTYRAVPPKAWVEKPGAKWVEVTGQPPGAGPLATLEAPLGTQVVSDAADALVIDASYAPAALGLPGKDAVTVRMSVAGDGSVTATYTTTTSSGQAASSTVLVPSAGLKPVVAP